MKYTIGTRGSKLALYQANFVKDKLENLGYKCEIKIIKTSGDKNQTSFSEIPLKKLFVKEIEEELLEGKIDLAVHSMKDMPYEEVEGLCMGAFPDREDPRDAIIVERPLKTIGTGSERRRIVAEQIYGEAQILPIRGNVDTRIEKMKNGDYDGIILASAGLKRLGLQDKITKYFEVEEMVPSPCQGIIGVQCRKNDIKVLDILRKIDKEEIRKIVEIERLYGELYNGGCKNPVGAYAEKIENIYKIYTMRVSKDKLRKNVFEIDEFDIEKIKIEFMTKG